jgi:hypothetical protein
MLIQRESGPASGLSNPPESTAPPEQVTPLSATSGRTYLYGAALGLIAFLIHLAGPISAALHPPAGYEPAWTTRNLDFPQYLTWISALRSSALLPNFHSPWITAPTMLQPLFLAISKIPLPPIAAYYTASAALYIGAGIALMYAATVFCPGAEKYGLLASACALPLGLLVFAFGKMFHFLPLLVLGLFGILDYSYTSADGLFRGGQGAALTLSLGTAFLLLFMALLAKYVATVAPSTSDPSLSQLLAAVDDKRSSKKDRSARHLTIALIAVSLISAFLHPFEICVMVAASLYPLWQCKRLQTWAMIAAAGALGIAPYLAITATSDWFRDLSGGKPFQMYAFWIPENYGIPFFLVAYFLLIRFGMESPRDRILQSWFLSTIALGLLNFTMTPHLFDGFAYCVGFLLVRRLATDPKLMPAIRQHRRGVSIAVGTIATVCAFSLVALYAQIWQDGRKAEPEWLLTALRPASERPLLDWLRTHASPNTLVLAPADVAPWIATVPMHSFASHDLFDIAYEDHAKLATAFFKGDDVQRELLENFGVGIAVVPGGSPAMARLPAAAYRTSVGPWRIYEFPDARMKPYPGIASLHPDAQPSLRARLFAAVSGLLRR